MKGHNQRQIANILKVGLTSVNEDLQCLRRQAKENIRHYINEYLPVEYENCLDGLNEIMAQAWQMSLDGDKRERMQALSLAKECYAMKLDLLSSATIVDRAIRFVDNHRRLIPQNKEVTIDDSAEPQ